MHWMPLASGISPDTGLLQPPGTTLEKKYYYTSLMEKTSCEAYNIQTRENSVNSE